MKTETSHSQPENTTSPSTPERKKRTRISDALTIGSIATSVAMNSLLMAKSNELYGDPFGSYKNIVGAAPPLLSPEVTPALPPLEISQATRTAIHEEMFNEKAPDSNFSHVTNNAEYLQSCDKFKESFAKENGFSLIEARDIQHDIKHSTSLEETKQHLISFTNRTGIKIVLVDSPDDIRRAGINSPSSVTPINPEVSDEELLKINLNTIDLIDGIASIPKETYVQLAPQFTTITIVGDIVLPNNNHPSGLYAEGLKSIVLKLDHTEVNNFGGIYRHEFGHVLDAALVAKGLRIQDTDPAFTSINGAAYKYDKSNINRPVNYQTQTTPYASTEVDEDRADTFRYLFKDISLLENASNKYINTEYDKPIIVKKKELLLARAETLQPGLGKFLANTAIHTPQTFRYMMSIDEQNEVFGSTGG